MKRDAEQTAGDGAKRLKAGEDNLCAPVHADEAERQLKQSSLLDVVYAQKKLFLVLDLDHTLLNSAPFPTVDPDEALRIAPLFDDPSGSVDIHTFPDIRIVTKLRPFVHEFLCQASTMFEMYVYTMGARTYAEAVVRLLDPSQHLFGNRIISRDDNNGSVFKSLDLILAPASATIILDDSHQAWPDSLANLIQMDRYHFFDSSSKQFAEQTPSLLGSLKDESDAGGTLARTLDLLRTVHHAFFDEADSQKSSSVADQRDVRRILHGFRSSLLTGCKIIFSRLFAFDPKAHPLWRLAEQLGAVCSTTLDDSITHVVAFDAGTEKAEWARQHKRHLVHPRWIEATFFTWKRIAESDYAVDATPMLHTFSELTTLLQANACNTSSNAPTQQQSYVVVGPKLPTVQCCS